MPLTHTSTLRVRYYECDPYGHVNNTNYLRYLEEAAFDASAAAGFDIARYQAMNRMWLVRETDIEYLRPLRYGDTVAIKTWIADFRRVQSRRMYELTNVATGELAARAHTDWVFVDTTTGALVSIPPEFASIFFPEGVPPVAPPRERFPEPPPPPPGIFRLRQQVEWQDIDTAWHVNNAVYLRYVENCSMAVIAAHGWPVQRMTAEGFAILLRRHQIQYLQPALLDDELEVATWVSEVKRVTALRHYTITRVRDGALLARVNTLGVWVNLATGQPMRPPASFLADFAPNIAKIDASQDPAS
jgi:acyl-CoA thioester hydrolase